MNNMIQEYTRFNDIHSAKKNPIRVWVYSIDLHMQYVLILATYQFCCISSRCLQKTTSRLFILSQQVFPEDQVIGNLSTFTGLCKWWASHSFKPRISPRLLVSLVCIVGSQLNFFHHQYTVLEIMVCSISYLFVFVLIVLSVKAERRSWENRSNIKTSQNKAMMVLRRQWHQQRKSEDSRHCAGESATSKII